MKQPNQPENQTINKFNPKIEDIETARKSLNELKSQFKENNINDPEGKLSNKTDELEKMYEDIKMKAKQSATNSEQALLDMKQGFLTAWSELKKAAEQAKENFGSTPKH